MSAPRPRLLLLCGSLRRASLNRMVLRCFARRCAGRFDIAWDSALGQLPLFDADLDVDGEHPAAVQALRDDVAASDALVIASPEYAHGVSGVLKNGLDWLVSDTRFVGKPVLITNYSPRSTHAIASLREILVTMSANVVGDTAFPIAVRSRNLGDEDVLADAGLVAAIDAAVEALQSALAQRDA